ncbi:MAG: tRNA pseudouridine(38-40) synthase TruA [Lachnospiraceae bacterium]
MRTYKMTINYDGSQYQGWQRQVNTNATIQWVLEWTIGKLMGYCVKVDASGRTDSGVHAKGQVATVELSGAVDEIEFRHSLNLHLPEDIKVTKVELVKGGFHARRNATGKCYEYLLDQREKPDVFMRRYCYHYPKELDLEAMREACKYLIGRHDFKSFTDKKNHKSTVRSITNITIEQLEQQKVKICYQGTGFLYHMVRILMGTLLEVGSGQRNPRDMQTILEGQERALAGYLAPARGLTLKEVYYQ